MSMIKITRSFTRASTNIPWHDHALALSPYKTQIGSLVTSGVILSNNRIESQDGLNLTYEMTFADQNHYDQYLTDATLNNYWLQRNAYCTRANITMSQITVETI